MCGFAGWVSLSPAVEQPEVLDAMSWSLEHRGPDEGSTWDDGTCFLAHRRLSIIDLASSHQPMLHPAGAGVLVFNGEIYNFETLRRELQGAGATFETRGDTEVLLQILERDGPPGIDRLDGMFAFARWDRRRRTLLLARDPLGVKPLYYARPDADTLVFGSEIKAVLRHPAVDRGLDHAGLRQVLRFRSVYGTRTLHRGVAQLEPGTWLEFGPAGLRSGRHYDLAERAAAERELARSSSDDRRLERARGLFEDAVRKRLIADVPVGAFLSGGLDSSLIVAAMRRLRDPSDELRTFSVGFRGDRDSELPFAARVAEAVGSVHREVTLGEADYAAGLAPFSAFRDAPLSEPADVAMGYLSREAKRVVKVVLSGEGADEAFCGYPKYRFAEAPWALRAGLRLLGAERCARVGAALGLEARRVRIAVRSLGERDELDRLMVWFSYLDRAQLRSLLPGLGWDDEDWQETRAVQVDALARFAGWRPLIRMQGLDLTTWLPCNLLERGDRMTMSAGLEGRVPFLDKALVPCALALPARLKVRGRVLKWPLRQWAREQLPAEIARRRKWGFRVPLAAWFREGLRETLRDHLMDPAGICGRFGDATAISGLLERHDRGEVDANLALWTLLAVEVWERGLREPTSHARLTG